MALRYSCFSSEFGPLLAVSDKHGLVRLEFQKGENPDSIDHEWIRDEAFFKPLAEAIRQYARGKSPLPKWKLGEIKGTPFQLKVWKELQRIPHGKMRTYGEIAARLGQPKAMRAVGTACGKNPVPLFIPCHRVLAASGHLGGFSAGLPVKRKLLHTEGIEYKE